MFNEKVKQFVRFALEASIYASPREAGLTFDELIEVGRQLGFQRGEIEDVLRELQRSIDYQRGSGVVRLVLREGGVLDFADFIFRVEGDVRKPEAFDFVVKRMKELAREHGERGAEIERDVLVAQAVAERHDRSDIEVAITMLMFAERLLEGDGLLRLPPGGASYPTASEQIAARDRDPPLPRPDFLKIKSVVEDTVRRRTDGRPASADAIEAFGALLEAHGESALALWWRQTAAEVKRASPTQLPTAVVTLAAALCEGAVVFLANAVPEFRDALNTEYKGGLKNWRFDGVMRALRRPPNPVFDPAPRSPSGNIAERALALNEIRQRIHPGRLLHEPNRYPHPDARPEEASEAREVATRLARIVLDWITKNPLPAK